jgi:hypothetical protein
MAGVGAPLMTAWQARERGERGGRRRGARGCCWECGLGRGRATGGAPGL